MSDINKFTTKEVLNKVLLDSSGNAVTAFSHTTQEAFNAVLDTTNNRLNMSLAGGTISGDVTISGDLTISGSSTYTYDEQIDGQLWLKDSTASSATQGGHLRLFSDDGAAMAAGHRLGVIEFAGAEDASSTITVGARIEALAESTYTASENGSSLSFYTTDGNASQSEVLKLDSNKLATFSGNLTFTHSGATISSTLGFLQLRTLETGKGMLIDCGDNFEFRDMDSGNAVRLTIASSTGNVTFTGNNYLSNDKAIWMRNNAGNADTSAIFTNTSDELVLRTGGSTDSLKINTSGNVGIGKTPATILDIDSGTIGESSAENAGVRITGQRNGNITALTMRHEQASGGATGSDNGIGMHFQGYDGSNSYHNMGAIYVRSAEDSVSDSDSPGYMTFHTTPNGSDTIQERIRIDSSGNTNLNSNYIINEQGKPNHVGNTMSSPYYRFDAVDDKIVPSSAFGLVNINFSISCWVRHTSRTDNTWEAIYSQDITEIWFGFGQNSDAQGRVRLHVGGNTDYADTPNGVVPEGVWTHVSATWDGTNAKIYVNGVSQTITVSGTLNNPASESAYKIGGHSGSNNNQYLGELNNLSFWNRALSETEVKELYSGSSVPFKYKGANQTTLTANGTDWTGGSPPTSWAVYKATATSAGSGFSGDCVAVTADTSGSANYLYQTRTLTVGKYYRLSAYVKSGTSGNETFEISFRAGTLGGVLASVTGTSSGSWVKHSVDWLCTQSAITVSLAKTTTTSGTMLFDSAELVPIGAVAEYDGSGITNGKWYDKSGNELHGTVTGASDENTAGAPVISENHPCFSVLPSSPQANIAVGSDVTVVFGTEVFDVGSNFASNTFTAPVTGKYQLCASVRLDSIDVDANYYYLRIKTSNRDYSSILDPGALSGDPAYWSLNLPVLADMDVNDTAYVIVKQVAGSSQTDIDTEAFFTGHLVC